jgi:hypothetical protein
MGSAASGPPFGRALPRAFPAGPPGGRGRPLIGNRVCACDDCQLARPWNRFAALGQEADLWSRWDLDTPTRLDLFVCNEAQFLARTEGRLSAASATSPGHAMWGQLTKRTISYGKDWLGTFSPRNGVESVRQGRIWP